MSDTRLASSAGWFAGAVAVFCLTTSSLFAASDTLDLKQAVVVFDKTVKGPQVQAVRVLVEEVQKRTQIAWSVADTWPEKAPAVIVVGLASFVDSTLSQHGVNGAAETRAKGAEGYQVRATVPGNPAVVTVVGNDERGVLFGVGNLLRELRMKRRRVAVPAELSIATAPKYPLRGHQLGYRPKTNSYDAWYRADVGAVHPRPGRLRHQRDRADPAALGRCSRQPALSAAADAR